MLLLLFEIALTIWVWKRGWKAWALLPLGFAFGVSFIIGFVEGFSGNADLDPYLTYFALLDVVVVITLIAMGMKGRDVPTVDTAQYPAAFPAQAEPSEHRFP